MAFTIRTAEKKDIDRIWELIHELAVFEKEEDAVEVTPSDLLRDGFGVDKRFHCFVAETKEGIMGMALIFHRYSTWKGPIIHLEDLIVSKKARGSGLGSALLHRVVRYGSELGVKRINWEVLDWNEPAIRFYENNGAKVMRDWNVVQMDEKGIARFLEASTALS
ncbi:MAG: GNAT family N-acetyltransferase [Bacteroidota bacterium]